MSDDNRDEAGQFTSAEPLFGKAAIEQEAGYVPYEEEAAPDDSSDLTVAEAASEFTNSRTPEAEIKTYSAVSDLPANVTLTVEQATKILTDDHAADVAQAEMEGADAIRAEVDKLRGEKPETEQSKKPEAQAEPASDGDPDAELEKALNNPRIKEAIAAQIGQNEAVRQNYQASIVAATTIAQTAFISQFPELANITTEQLPQAMMAMQQQDPGRYAQVESAVMKSLNLFEQHKAEQQRIDDDKQARFQNYAKAQDARFETMIKGETKETMRAVEGEIIAAIKDYGGDPAQFFAQYQSSEFLRDAVTQRMMVDAAKYRMLKSTTLPKPSAKPLPPVHRPGVAAPRVSYESGALSRAQAAFDKNPSLKNGAALYTAEHNAKARRG